MWRDSSGGTRSSSEMSESRSLKFQACLRAITTCPYKTVRLLQEQKPRQLSVLADRLPHPTIPYLRISTLPGFTVCRAFMWTEGSNTFHVIPAHLTFVPWRSWHCCLSGCTQFGTASMQGVRNGTMELMRRVEIGTVRLLITG